jgi:hypothetical protein
MPFSLFQKNDVDETIKPIVLPPSVTTRTEAIAALAIQLQTYKEHGYDPQQDQWWARDKDGNQYTFWILP